MGNLHRLRRFLVSHFVISCINKSILKILVGFTFRLIIQQAWNLRNVHQQSEHKNDKTLSWNLWTFRDDFECNFALKQETTFVIRKLIKQFEEVVSVPFRARDDWHEMWPRKNQFQLQQLTPTGGDSRKSISMSLFFSFSSSGQLQVTKLFARRKHKYLHRKWGKAGRQVWTKHWQIRNNKNRLCRAVTDKSIDEFTAPLGCCHCWVDFHVVIVLQWIEWKVVVDVECVCL